MTSWKGVRLARRLAAVVGVAVLWQIATASQPAAGGFPVPSRVLQAGGTLLSRGDLQEAFSVSFGRVAEGYIVALALAIPIGLGMGYWLVIDNALDPIVQTLRSVAPIAILPLAILWFGTGTVAAVFVIAYAAFFPVAINVTAGVRRIDRSLIRAARTMGAGRASIIRHVVIPGVLPSLFVGARLSMGVSWAVIIAAELAVGAKTGASGGLGQLMFIDYAYSINMNAIVPLMITVGLAGFSLDQGLRILQRKATPWTKR